MRQSTHKHSKPNPREVNDLLHTLRGEQFRHSQNTRQSRSHLLSSYNFNARTLPLHLTTTDPQTGINATLRSSPATHSKYAGPAPPKSWLSHDSSGDVSDNTSKWRAQALAIFASCVGNFPSPDHVPPLSMLCLQMILSKSTDSTVFKDEVVPHIPQHLRRDLVRHCAVYSPLPPWKLAALYEPVGHAAGELMVVCTTENSDIYLNNSPISMEGWGSQSSPNQDTWETEDESPVPLLQSFILIKAMVNSSTLLSLPPTLVNLVLISLPTPIPIHRLPKICPLLSLLDLSYNFWLSDSAADGYEWLKRVEWSRWAHLKVVGLRGCYVDEALTRKIHTGRWDEIHIAR